MSWQALDWVRKQRVGHAHSKAVLVQLANFADDNASCFPSHEYLSDQVEVSERTIQECMRKLEGEGYLTTKRDRLENGRLGLTRYTLCLGREPTRPPEAASGGDQRQTEEEPPEADATPAEPASGQIRQDTLQGNPEREARAQAGKIFETITKGYPKAALDDLAKAEVEFLAMSATDQVEFADRLPDVVAFLAGERRRPPLQEFVRDRRWRLVPKRKAEDGAKREITTAPGFSRTWWWLFFDYVARHPRQLSGGDAPEKTFLRLKISAALSRFGSWPMPAEARERIEESAKQLVQIRVNSIEFEAWRKALSRNGVNLPTPDKADWIYVPSPHPPSEGEDFAAVAMETMR